MPRVGEGGRAVLQTTLRDFIRPISQKSEGMQKYCRAMEVRMLYKVPSTSGTSSNAACMSDNSIGDTSLRGNATPINRRHRRRRQQGRFVSRASASRPSLPYAAIVI